MGARGKKSKAEKMTPVASVIDLPALGPPPPPAKLKASEKRRWKDVVGAYPAERWKPSDLLLLRDMITCERYAADCDELIKNDGLLTPNRYGDLSEHPAVAVREKMGRQILAIQRALRLSPSTRSRPESAKVRPTKGGANKPWAK